ncbi:hypothetical protein PUN28_017892 [Cardiocondyla obscurior]|uniref:Uncharacterized protein n=1 Tax=Cardiocondyla obscurior TaxID=286306 RepID=A0AAW2ELJ0_9HYME
MAVLSWWSDLSAKLRDREERIVYATQRPRARSHAANGGVLRRAPHSSPSYKRGLSVGTKRFESCTHCRITLFAFSLSLVSCGDSPTLCLSRASNDPLRGPPRSARPLAGASAAGDYGGALARCLYLRDSDALRCARMRRVPVVTYAAASSCAPGEEWRVRRFSPLLFLRSRARAIARAEGFVEYASHFRPRWFFKEFRPALASRETQPLADRRAKTKKTHIVVYSLIERHMNIDISNAHCGPRIQFPDHAWLRVVLSKTNCLRAPFRRPRTSDSLDNRRETHARTHAREGRTCAVVINVASSCKEFIRYTYIRAERKRVDLLPPRSRGCSLCLVRFLIFPSSLLSNILRAPIAPCAAKVCEVRDRARVDRACSRVHESAIRRDHPLNLSILLSGGKETNQDFLSSGERTGKSPAPNPAVPPQGNVVFGRVRLSRGAASRPRKVEKNFEERVQEYVKPFRGKPKKPKDRTGDSSSATLASRRWAMPRGASRLARGHAAARRCPAFSSSCTSPLVERRDPLGVGLRPGCGRPWLSTEGGWAASRCGSHSGASRSHCEKRRTQSVHVGTRKMVNYAWSGRSQGKP